VCVQDEKQRAKLYGLRTNIPPRNTEALLVQPLCHSSIGMSHVLLFMSTLS